jgi:hypothetical protein
MHDIAAATAATVAIAAMSAPTDFQFRRTLSHAPTVRSQHSLH